MATSLKVETGYLLLEECELRLHHGGDQVPDSEWFDVKVTDSPSSRFHDASTNDMEDCCHCQLLVVQVDPSCKVLNIVGSRFDGTIPDVKPARARCRCQPQRQRADAALLVGLALTCQELGHISRTRVRLILHGQRKLQYSTASRRRKASMYITFHISEILQQFNSHFTPTVRQFISNSPKILPPSTQLLLSLIRSDWDYLDAFIVRKQSDAAISETRTRRNKRPQLFPSKLSLDEVYQRIGGAALALDEKDIDTTTLSKTRR